MTKPDFPEEFEKDETPEEYIKNRVADIDQKKGYLYAQARPVAVPQTTPDALCA